jgi:hypothetical protein
MEPGYIKLFCDFSLREPYSINGESYYGDKLHNFLSENTYIHKVTITNCQDKYQYNLFRPYNLTINKLCVTRCTMLERLFICFERINEIHGDIDPRLAICTKKLLSYPIKIYSPTAPYEDKLAIFYYSKSESNFHKIPMPGITHLCIYVSEHCTTEMLLTVLSNPFERINIRFDSRCTHIDMAELTTALIANPAKHIYIKNIHLNYDYLLRLMVKPGIVTLRLNKSTSYLRYEDYPIFDENYTLLRFYIKGGHRAWYISTNVYERNLKFLNESRFKKTKVANLS